MSVNRRGAAVGCVVVFLAALAVRAAVLATLANSPFFSHPVIDAAHHDLWARVLAGEAEDTTREFKGKAFFKPPLYPYLLAGWYRVAGRVLWPVKAFQAALGALGCAAVFWITRRLFGRGAGWVAGVLGALYWPWIFFDAWLLNTELAMFFDLAAACVLMGYAEGRGGNLWRAACAGLLLGLSAITWPTALLVCCVLAVWLGGVALRGAAWRRRVFAVGLFVAAAALPVLAVAARNRVVAHDWVLISSNAGINFYTGGRPEADGVTAVPTGVEWQRLMRKAPPDSGMSASQASRYWFGAGWANVKAAPGRNARLTLKRAAVFFSGAEPRNNLAQNYFLQEYPWLNLLVDFRVLGPCWFAGLGWWVWLGRRKGEGGDERACWATRRRGGALCLAFVLTRWASVLPFFVCDRFRVVAVPFMLPFAGLAAVEFWRLRRGRRAMPLAVIALLAGAAIWVDWFHARPREFAQEHFFLARIAGEKGDARRALAEMRKSLEARESADAWLLLSGWLAEGGEYEKAAAAAEKCLVLAADDPFAHRTRAYALMMTHRFAEALPHAGAAVQLMPQQAAFGLLRAELLLLLNRPAEAQAELQRTHALKMDAAEVTVYEQLQQRLNRLMLERRGKDG